RTWRRTAHGVHELRHRDARRPDQNPQRRPHASEALREPNPSSQRPTPDGYRGHDRPQHVAGAQRSYISAVAKFSRYFGRSPDRLTLEDVRGFQVHLVSIGISWPALNQIVCALRFFYGVTLGEA